MNMMKKRQQEKLFRHESFRNTSSMKMDGDKRKKERKIFKKKKVGMFSISTWSQNASANIALPSMEDKPLKGRPDEHFVEHFSQI